MAVFQESEQLYACMQRLFDRVQNENPGAAAQVEQGRLIIQVACFDPDVRILINGRRRPAQISFGANRVRPEVQATMPADTLHEILLGNLKLSRALGQQRMQVKGPVIKALTLAELFLQCQALYPQVLADQGFVL